MSKASLVIGALCVAVVASACGGGLASRSADATVSGGPSAALAGSPGSPAAQTAAPAPTVSAVSPTPLPSPSGAGVPDFRHVYLIVMENKEYSRIVGSASAPYLNSLIARYGLATQFYGETHPSEPNYIALTSGGLQGTNSDGTYNLDVPNLFDQIDGSGRTWHVYAQGFPGNCFGSYQATPVLDGPGAVGDYVRKHNPAMSYTSISGNPTRCANITGLAGFDPAAADFEFIAPNQINDMHSSSVGAGDAFLKTFLPEIVDSPAFADSVLFITWDEGDTNVNGGGHIATIVASPSLAPGSRFEAICNHYSILRTIELAWGLPLLGEAQTARTLSFP